MRPPYIFYYENNTRLQNPARVGRRRPLLKTPFNSEIVLFTRSRAGARIEYSFYTVTDSHGLPLTTVRYMKFITRTGSRATSEQPSIWTLGFRSFVHNVIFVRFTIASKIRSCIPVQYTIVIDKYVDRRKQFYERL